MRPTLIPGAPVPTRSYLFCAATSFASAIVQRFEFVAPFRQGPLSPAAAKLLRRLGVASDHKASRDVESWCERDHLIASTSTPVSLRLRSSFCSMTGNSIGGELGEGSVLTEGGYPSQKPTSKVPARRSACFLVWTRPADGNGSIRFASRRRRQVRHRQTASAKATSTTSGGGAAVVEQKTLDQQRLRRVRPPGEGGRDGRHRLLGQHDRDAPSRKIVWKLLDF